MAGQGVQQGIALLGAVKLVVQPEVLNVDGRDAPLFGFVCVQKVLQMLQEVLLACNGCKGTRLYCADDCVTFIRFSDTNWSVFNRGNVINLEKKIGDFDHTVWPCGLMFAWTDSSIVSLQTRITSVFCDASGDKAPTRYYTADQSEMEKGAYDVTISENDVWSPSTADAITAAAVIAVLISGVAAVSKKARKA